MVTFHKIIYAFVLAFVLTTTLATAIVTLYPAPVSPGIPTAGSPISFSSTNLSDSATPSAAETKYEQDRASFDQKTTGYAENIFYLSVIFAVVLLVIATALTDIALPVASGMLLSGMFVISSLQLFILFNSVISSFSATFSQDNVASPPAGRLTALAVLTVITLAVGLWKFREEATDRHLTPPAPPPTLPPAPVPGAAPPVYPPYQR